jgi:WD40 repeat protein
VDAVVFSGDGKRIASGSMDTTVIVWDALSGQQQLRLLHGHNNERVVFVAFSPGGSKLVSTSKGGNICVWDVDTGALLSGPSQRHEEDGALTVLFTPHSGLYAISPDGEWVERCLGERERDNPIVQVCDSKTGLFAFTFRVHTARVRSIGFCPDSRRILSTSSDGTVRVCAFDW